jgi:hypothetical protein
MKRMTMALCELADMMRGDPELPDPALLEVADPPEPFSPYFSLRMHEVGQVAKWGAKVKADVVIRAWGPGARAMVIFNLNGCEVTEIYKDLPFEPALWMVQFIDNELTDLGVRLPPDTVLSALDRAEHAD